MFFCLTEASVVLFLVLFLVGWIPRYCSNCFQLPSDSNPDPS